MLSIKGCSQNTGNTTQRKGLGDIIKCQFSNNTDNKKNQLSIKRTAQLVVCTFTGW